MLNKSNDNLTLANICEFEILNPTGEKRRRRRKRDTFINCYIYNSYYSTEKLEFIHKLRIDNNNEILMVGPNHNDIQ